MKNKAYLPVGTVGNVETVLISKGDVVELCTGELITFTEMKRVKFIGIMNGKGVQVPVYRNRMKTIPYILKVTGKKDKSVIVKSAPLDKFKAGELFALGERKETFMFVKNFIKKGNKKTEAIDLATGNIFTLGGGFTIIKIDVNKLKRELKTA